MKVNLSYFRIKHIFIKIRIKYKILIRKLKLKIKIKNKRYKTTIIKNNFRVIFKGNNDFKIQIISNKIKEKKVCIAKVDKSSQKRTIKTNRNSTKIKLKTYLLEILVYLFKMINMDQKT